MINRSKSKKKILIASIHMDMGGIEKSLLNLLQELSKENNYDVDLFIFYQNGILKKEFEKYAKILPENPNLKLIGMSQLMTKQYGFGQYAKRLVLGGIAKYFSQEYAYKLLMKDVKIEKEYDVAISYQNSLPNSLYGGTNEFVLNNISATKKIAFIHGDLVLANLNNDYNMRVYKMFDKIASVSESCMNLFIEEWPELRDKACVVRNCSNIEEILALAQERVDMSMKDINFVTVARLSYVKGLERTLKIFVKLKEKYDNFTWHIIGAGECTENLQSIIKENGLEEYVFLHGEKKNPYPYIKNADAFLLVSFQEAAPVVFNEAKILKTPILTTKTRSAWEMVGETRSGIVCENTEDGIYNMLCDVMTDQTILYDLRNKMQDYSNDDAFNAFKSLMEE